MNKHPERDIMLHKTSLNKAEITEFAKRAKKANKTVIVSDSITKRINMVKFNNALHHGNAVNEFSQGQLHPN